MLRHQLTGSGAGLPKVKDVPVNERAPKNKARRSKSKDTQQVDISRAKRGYDKQPPMFTKSGRVAGGVGKGADPNEKDYLLQSPHLHRDEPKRKKKT